MQDQKLKLDGINLESLPEGLSLTINLPGLPNGELKFSTIGGLDLEENIRQALALAQERNSMDLATLSLNVFTSEDLKLTDEERDQYIYASGKIGFRAEAYLRFLTMVATRLFMANI